jgi:hypothetical protein
VYHRRWCGMNHSRWIGDSDQKCLIECWRWGRNIVAGAGRTIAGSDELFSLDWMNHMHPRWLSDSDQKCSLRAPVGGSLALVDWTHKSNLTAFSGKWLRNSLCPANVDPPRSSHQYHVLRRNAKAPHTTVLRAPDSLSVTCN